jgi:predicted RND superfamily exporter protein
MSHLRRVIGLLLLALVGWLLTFGAVGAVGSVVTASSETQMITPPVQCC